MSRNPLVRLLCAVLLLSASGIAMSQAFPSRPLRIIVPYAAGGQPDVVSRVVAKHMSTTLGQPITIDNISGGTGVPAVNSLLSGRPDGYTLIALDAGIWAVNPAARPDLPYDPERSFAPVGLVTTSSLFLAIHHSVPANNLPELVALIKQKPGQLNYGSSGIGSLHHLTVEAFKQSLGLDIAHIPFRGTGQSVPALVGGQVQMVVAGLNSLAQFEKAGRVKILGANTLARSPLAPEIPALSSVAPNLDFPAQVGFLGPAAMPREAVERLARALDEALQAAEVIAALKSAGMEPAPVRGPDALAKRIQSDRANYGALIRSVGIKLE